MHVPITGTAILIGAFVIAIYIIYRLAHQPTEQERAEAADEEFNRGYEWADQGMKIGTLTPEEIERHCYAPWDGQEPFHHGAMAAVYHYQESPGEKE